MALKPGRYLRLTFIVLALLISAVAIGLIPVNLFFAKDAITEWVRENTGGELEIEGPLRLRLGLRPVLNASGIRFAPAGLSDPAVVQADSLFVRSRIGSILHKELDIRELQVIGIAADYCHQPDCRPDFLPEQLNLYATAALDQALTFEIEGQSAAGDLKLSASGDSLNRLLDNPDEYPLDLEFHSTPAVFKVSGIVQKPLSNAQLNARLDLHSESLSRLLQVFGIETAAVDPGELSVQTDLGVSSAEIRFQNLVGSLNEHHFALDGRLRGLGARPWIELDGQLNKLDLEQLSAKQEKPAGPADPDTGFSTFFELINQFDGKLNLRLGRLLSAPVPVDELAVQARLEQGLLSLDHIDVFVSNNPVEASGELDTGLPCPRLESRLLLHDFNLQALNQWLKPGTELGGKAERVQMNWSSCGRSAGAHLTSMKLQSGIDHLNLRNGGKSLPADFDTIRLSASWLEPGHASLHARMPDETLAVELGFGSIESMTSGINWPLSVSAHGPGSHVASNGDVALAENSLNLDIDMEIEVDRFGSLHWMGADPQCQLPLSARSHLAIGTEGAVIENLEVRLGSSDIRGSFSWAGPDTPRPMIFKGRAGKVNLSELASLFPGSAKKSAADSSELMEILPENGWVDKWLRFPPVDIDLGIAELSGIKHTVSNVDLQAQLRDRQVTDGRLKLQFRNADADGLFNLDFRESPGNASYNIQLDKVDVGALLADLELADGIEMQAKQIRIKSATHGDTLKELTESLQIQASVEGLNWVFTTGPENISNQLNLEQLDLAVSPGEQTTGQTRGTINGVPLSAYLQLPGVVDSFDLSKNLPLKLVVGTGNDITILEGVFNRRTPGNRQATLTVSGKFTGREGIDFSRLEPPLSDYAVNGELTWRDNEFLLKELQLSVGESVITGFVDLRYMAPRYLLDVDLHSPFLETDDLVHLAEDYRNTERILRDQKDTHQGDNTIDTGMIGLLSQQFEAFAEKFDFNLNASVDELRSAGTLLGKLSLESHSKNKNFQLVLDTELDGGNININYHGIDSVDGSEYSLDLHVERLEYGGLVRLLDADSEGNGLLHVDTVLTSKAPGPAQLVNHLQGTFDMLVIPENVQAAFLDLWAANLVFALLPTGNESKKKMNCMVARFEVEDGIMTSKDTFLDSTDIIVRARGDIDLVNRKLDLVAAPQAKLEKFLSVQTPIRVTGTFDDPSIGLAPIGFIGTMIRWYYGLIYVPWKWLTGERFPADGLATCHRAMDWEASADPGYGVNPP